MTFNTLNQIDFSGKTALVRLDLNVPLHNGVMGDTTRLTRVIPTLKALQEKGAKIVIMAHLGRPKGKKVASLSLMPVAEKLGEVVGSPVRFSTGTIGSNAESNAAALSPGDILLLENLRFYAEEEQNDADFAKSLAKLGDVYVNDAFSVSHRAHASVAAITNFLPAVAGLLMQEELTALTNALTSPERPVMAIIGGAKVSTKVDLLNNLVKKVNVLAIGGGMANTFLLAQNYDIANSFCDRESADTARTILNTADEVGCRIILPQDAVVAEKLEAGVETHDVLVSDVPKNTMILDIGVETIEILKEALNAAKTVVWNGPLGVFETPPFDTGTTAVAQHAAALTEKGDLVSVAGGGDTVAALNHAGVVDQFSYLSTAGGAFLEWLEGKTLPGVAALETAGAAASVKKKSGAA